MCRKGSCAFKGERKRNCRGHYQKLKYTIGNDNIDGPFHDLQRKINETFDKLIYNHES